MATTLKLERAKYVSGPREIRRMPEAASQGFHPGQFVSLNSNSQVQANATNDTATLGMAQGYATGTTNAETEVLLAGEDTVFEMTISGASDPTFAIADMGVKLAFLVANNRTYMDVDDTDNDVGVIVALKKTGDGGSNLIGDDYVRAFVKILPDSFQFGGGGESA